MATWEQVTDSFGYTYRINPFDNGMYCDPCLHRGGECRLVFHYRDANDVYHYRCEKYENHIIRIKDHGQK